MAALVSILTKVDNPPRDLGKTKFAMGTTLLPLGTVRKRFNYRFDRAFGRLVPVTSGTTVSIKINGYKQKFFVNFDPTILPTLIEMVFNSARVEWEIHGNAIKATCPGDYANSLMDMVRNKLPK